METIYNKLVRDKIPEIIENDGQKVVIRKLDDNEYKIELGKKLLEEYNEFLTAQNQHERLEELADMLEIISTISSLEEASLSSIISIMNEKREKRGGFTKKIFLVKTKSK